MDEVTINKYELGERIVALRNSMNLNQDDFGALCGLSRPTISNIETGKRSATSENLAKIAKVCGVTIDYLQYGENFGESIKFEGLLASDKEYIRFYLNLSPDQRKNMMVMIKQFYPEACR